MRPLLLVVLALAGCAESRKPELPPVPEVIRVPVKTFVPISDELTQLCPWTRDGKPSEVFDVSHGRKVCLEQYEGQLKAIEAIQGRTAP